MGDWVNVIKKGRVNSTEEIVVQIKKWVTFEDREGVKQVRASHNLIVSDSPASHHVRERDARGYAKC